MAIHDLTRRAFEGHAHSDGSEPDIVDRLRDADALTVSLLADVAGTIVGHVAFSPVAWDGHGQWAGLGPVSVDPDYQRRGIGDSLIREGLSRIRSSGFDGCVVLGEPGYYGRFGFVPDGRLTYPGVPPEYFTVLAFGPILGEGEVRYHSAFA